MTHGALRKVILVLARLGIQVNGYQWIGVPVGNMEVLEATWVTMNGQSCLQTSEEWINAEDYREKHIIKDKFLREREENTRVALISVANGFATRQGLVLSARGRIVNGEELDQRYFLENVSFMRVAPRPKRISGTVAAIVHRYDWNYFHWMFEVLPKLAVLELLGRNLGAIYISQAQAFQRESLSSLGLTRRHIVAADRAPDIQADVLVGVSHWDAFASVPKWACEFLRQRLGAKDRWVGDDRVYVSRADAKGRRVLNEDKVMDVLLLHGFRTVTLSEMPFGEQVSLFEGATAVAGVHGAGLSNVVFCRPGTVLIELCPPRYVFGCWHDLARKCGLRYCLVRAEGIDLDADHGWQYQREDFLVDIWDLKSVVAGCLSG